MMTDGGFFVALSQRQEYMKIGFCDMYVVDMLSVWTRLTAFKRFFETILRF